MVVASALLPPAKPDGLGRVFLSRLKPTQWLIATFITGLVTIGLLKTDGFILYLVSLFLVMLSISYIKPKLGGLTGDTLGAINEVLEVGGFFTAYIIIYYIRA
jgi:adenosylcobinamide-GDP ribazoletransferase